MGPVSVLGAVPPGYVNLTLPLPPASSSLVHSLSLAEGVND